MPEIELTIFLVIDIMGKCKYNYHKIGVRYYLFLTVFDVVGVIWFIL
jgi:hypothetical protein